MWEYGLGASTGALVELPPGDNWDNDLGLRGTVFPISYSERLYIGAKHTVPEAPQRCGILIWHKQERIVRAVVEEIREIRARPDLVVMRATEGVPTLGGISVDGPGLIWTDVVTAGYPEDVLIYQPDQTLVSVRGLKGYITRQVDPGVIVGYKGAAYELSFPIPTGMSGSPLAKETTSGLTGGLIGVCLGSHQTSTTEWEEEEDADGRVTRRYRVVELGVASLLGVQDIEPFTGRQLIDVMGWGAGGLANDFRLA